MEGRPAKPVKARAWLPTIFVSWRLGVVEAPNRGWPQLWRARDACALPRCYGFKASTGFVILKVDGRYWLAIKERRFTLPFVGWYDIRPRRTPADIGILVAQPSIEADKPDSPKLKAAEWPEIDRRLVCRPVTTFFSFADSNTSAQLAGGHRHGGMAPINVTTANSAARSREAHVSAASSMMVGDKAVVV